MSDNKNEINELLDSMIASSDEFTKNLKKVLPESMKDQIESFRESSVISLNRVRDLLNK